MPTHRPNQDDRSTPPRRMHADVRARPRPGLVTALIVITSTLATTTFESRAQTPPTTPGQSDTAPSTRPAAESVEPATRDRSLDPPLHTGATDRTPSAPVLREGSRVVRVRGRMRRNHETGWWRFIIEDREGHPPDHALIVLPCTHLAELERMFETAPDLDLTIELTGQVFVYRAQNYVVPTHPPTLVGHERRAPGSAPERRGPGAAAGDSADDIIRDLQRSIGPLPRRAPASGASLPDERLIPEGAVILGRRGTVRRGTGGAYVFIFDADAEGLADPPMVLMPCLLLERLEAYAQRAGEQAKVLLSGQVYAYRGRNYLRPSIFRIPKERTRLEP